MIVDHRDCQLKVRGLRYSLALQGGQTLRLALQRQARRSVRTYSNSLQ